MTVYVYSGTVGSGKSLHLANDIRHTLNMGRPVIGNFELASDAPVKNRDGYRYVPNAELNPQDLRDYASEYWREHSFHEDYILLALDEVQIIWNSRLWDKDKQGRLDWLEFFSQSRKWGYKVVLVAQSDKMIDNQMRMLIEYEVVHRKLSKFGTWGLILGTLFAGRMYLWITRYYANSEVLSRDWYFARSKDFGMYDSYKKFEQQ